MAIENKPMCQAQFIHEYNDNNREPFNEKLFKRDNQDIIDAVSNIIRSCERDKYFTLKVLSIRPILDYEEVYNALREHEENNKKKDKDNIYNYIQMKDSDIMLLEVKYYIRINGMERMKIGNKTVEVDNPEQVLQVLIALPRFVNKYYFRLSGNYYTSTIQIVDGSTYNNSGSNSSKADVVTLKTLFMSVRLFRGFRDVLELKSNKKMRCIVYSSIIFNSNVNAMYYILAKYGLYGTYNLFNINCIELSDKECLAEDYVCFKKHNIYISVPEILFQNHTIQSLAITIYDSINKDTTLEDLYNPRFWIKNLGAAFRNESIDKGLSALDSLESIYDINTKESIRLPESEKQNIYQVLKWMITDFTNLRLKDNTDASIKKFRISEYIAHALAMKISRGIHRITDMGKKVKLKQVASAVYIQPMFILSAIINMSNVVSYVDMVNDNDATTALKFTFKGISGLGEDGKNVQDGYRFVDPTSIGILDPDTSSNSDPGMTGMICPMADVYGDGFTDYVEPFTWDEQLHDLMSKYYNGQEHINPLSMKNDITELDYIKEEIVKENINVGRRLCPLKDLDGYVDYRSDNAINPLASKPEPKLSSIFTIIDREDTNNGC